MTDLTVIHGGLADEASDSATTYGTRAWAQQVRKRAKVLSTELDQGYMELARILYQVRETPVDGDPRKGPVYTGWGYATFGEWVEAELGLNEKKAERLRLIWFTLEVQLKDLDPEIKKRIVALGLGKVRELVRVLTLRNAESWVETAEKNTYRGVLKEVRDEKRRQNIEESILGSGDGNAAEILKDMREGDSPTPLIGPADDSEEQYKRRSFTFVAAQDANVQLAIQKASDLTGSDKDGHNLDLICTEFLATNDVMATEGDLERRLRYVAKIERMLRMKLVAIDPDSGEICYGIGYLEDMHKQVVGT